MQRPPVNTIHPLTRVWSKTGNLVNGSLPIPIGAKRLGDNNIMKKVFILAATVAAGTLAVPAAAENAGARVEAIVGYDNVDLGILGLDNPDGFMYGVGVGYDIPLSPTVSVGIDGEISDSESNIKLGGFKIEAARDLYVGGRMTFATSETMNLYVKAGYTNAKIDSNFAGSTKGDGIRGGVGLQDNLGGAYVGGEYRYSNYEDDVSRNQVVALIGYRF